MVHQMLPVYHPGTNLGDGEVHIWWAAINPPETVLKELTHLLSDDERERAGRYVFERDRRRYIAGRAFLRSLLSAYLKEPPASIVFKYSHRGKPGLQSAGYENDLQFNFSNAADWALAAVCRNHLVGIDLEQVHPMPDEDDFARQFFCPSEIALLRSRMGAEKLKTFFELWTCKEALLKAMGDGLTRPINEVEVLLENGTARLVSISGDQEYAERWRLALFQPAPGFQAALAVQYLENSPSTALLYNNAGGDFKPTAWKIL